MRFSISRKLLLFILPLLCLPIAIVGYSSIHASVERVDRLVRHEQMVEVKTAADRINDVIYYCRLDLETISRLPVIEDFHMARSFRLEAETEFNHENIVRLFRDFLRRTSYYYQIRYLDNEARELVRVYRDAGDSVPSPSSRFDAFPTEKFLQGDEIRISDVFYSPDRKGHLIHYAKPYVSSWGEFAGIIVVDLDFEKIIDIVKAIRVGERGYAVLIDQAGSNTAHPLFEPYRYHSTEGRECGRDPRRSHDAGGGRHGDLPQGERDPRKHPIHHHDRVRHGKICGASVEGGRDQLPHQAPPLVGRSASSDMPKEGMTLRDMEIELVRKTLQKCAGNKSLAAQSLGMSRKALYEKMERYGITF